MIAKQQGCKRDGAEVTSAFTYICMLIRDAVILAKGRDQADKKPRRNHTSETWKEAQNMGWRDLTCGSLHVAPMTTIELLGYCYGVWGISSIINFCCFGKHKEPPLREQQKIMALQWYPNLKLDGSWQMWTDWHMYMLLCVHSLGWTEVNDIQHLCSTLTQGSVHIVSNLM